MRYPRAKLLLTFNVLISMLLQVRYLEMASAVEKHHPSRLSEFTDVLCPYNVICREGVSMLTLPRGQDRTGCCTDCSCSDDCGLTESCCFPSLDRYRLVDRSHQECIYLKRTTPELYGYNMVVDSYPNGSGEYCGTADIPCGEDEGATALGALYPVFSKKTGRIYKNSKCAKCHGLNEMDIISWKVYLVCNTWSAGDVSTFLQFLDNGSMDPGCDLVFLYPGPSSDTWSEVCYSKASKNCTSDDFAIPDELNMTKDEVRAACHSDFTSMTYMSGSFKNIFCHLCDEYTTRHMDSTCNKVQLHEGDRTILGASFSTVLDAPAQNRKRKSVPQSGVGYFQRLACSVFKNLTDDCRQVYCPSAQVRHDDGHCEFPARHWNVHGISVNLNLYPKHRINVSSLRGVNFEGTHSNKIISVSPWPNHWHVTLMMFTATTTDAVDYFHVQLSSSRQNINVENVLTSIKGYMNQNWLLNVNDTIVPYWQAFSKYTTFVVFEDEILPMAHAIGQIPLSFTHNLTLPVFQLLQYTFMERPPSVVISKMFYCDQVLLKPDEYVYDVNLKLVLYKPTGNILFPGEIATAYDDGIWYTPKLCLEDAGFVLVDSSTTPMIRLWTILLCLLFGLTATFLK